MPRMNRPPRSADGKLKAREEQFCREYVVDFSGQHAAERAGFPPKSARISASKMMARPEIQARVSALMADRAAKTGVTAERVINELARVGFSRVTDYMRILEGGEPAIDLSDLNEDQKAAISEVVVEDFTEGRGDNARDVRRVRFKLHDKVNALQQLGKHLGIFEKDNAQRAPRLEAERLAAIDAEIEEMMHRGDTGNGAATRH